MTIGIMSGAGETTAVAQAPTTIGIMRVVKETMAAAQAPTTIGIIRIAKETMGVVEVPITTVLMANVPSSRAAVRVKEKETGMRVKVDGAGNTAATINPARDATIN